MKILLVEDNRVLSEWLARTLQADKYTVECVYDGSDADQLLRTETYDLVILDIALPGLDGKAVLKRLRGRHNPVPVLILTAYDGTIVMPELLETSNFRHFPLPHLEWPGRQEPGHGHVRAQNRRTLRYARAAG